MRKILILSPQSDQALAVARYLKRYDKNCILYGGCLPNEPLKELGPYDVLVKIADKNSLNSYDTILPTGAKSTYWIVTQVGNFYVNGLRYSRNNLQYFEKISLLERVQELGVPIPITYPSLAAIKEYPVFYKQRFEKGGGVRGVAYTREDLAKIPTHEDLLFQEYIPGGTTYGMGFIVKDGDFLTTFQHEETLSYPLPGGSAVYIRRFYDKRLEEYTKRIVQKLGFEGWGLAEFKYCKKRKDFVFMEVNAKLWASIEFAFINNNKFLKQLFGIDYPEKKVNTALFIDRLIALGPLYLFRNIHHLYHSRIFSYQESSKLLYSLATSFIPSGVRPIIKSMMTKSATR